MLPGAPVDDIEVAQTPIEIEMPNGIIERSTHTCNLRLPNLPKQVKKAHIVPGLSHSSLISIKQLCKGGCSVIFKNKICEVWYEGTLILTRRNSGPGGLWILPIDGRANLEDEEFPQCRQSTPDLMAATVYTLPYKQQKIKYMHQTFFAMPQATLEKAISNNQLKGFPMMTLKDLRRHLPPSPATPKGRMKRPKGGIRSTRKNDKSITRYRHRSVV